MHVAFPQDTFKKIVEYLGTKPFSEVENLMNELKEKSQGVVINPPEVTTTEPTKEGVDEIV